MPKWLGVLLQDPKGKGRWRAIDDEVDGILALDVPLELLGKPICQRSSAHLEAALHLIEVSFPQCTMQSPSSSFFLGKVHLHALRCTLRGCPAPH